MCKNINHAICAKCGGKCCLYSGCALLPSDISNPFRYGKLIKLMKTGNYSFKLALYRDLETNQLGYQLRIKARNVGRGVVDLFSTPNLCMHWSANKGCAFSDEQRPYEGLHLVPSPNYKCTVDYDVRLMFEKWMMVQQDLEMAFIRFSPNGWGVITTLFDQYVEAIEDVRELAETDYKEAAYLKTIQALLKQEGFDVSHI